ncbi:beta-glucosidase [Aquihabitans sp. G128]|uniref:GH1 family beta-glucosidase n=1 Tax=Aquihabitans sp. G128 TaxID=2849779 RepID=UPI001C240856|nr:GH1 family beta-glucosidase [Aquihabitans sp. G128]QXC59764.1 beta-glucosidase [Aquihabitans sp. G128]
MGDLARGDFGDDFTWGVAHAAYQVEGAWDADGKGPSIWDTFTHGKGRIRDHSTGDVACDFYHRSAEDTALVRELGFDAQRFSISWPRVLPEGTGRVNAKGLDFYDRVVDECLEAGVEPWVTLYHWDLPEALHQRGGWANRDVVGWFGEYVDVVAERLGDRVQDWMVFNEPCSFLLVGYLAGVHAPGVRSLRKFLAATHHVNLCQSVGASALRARIPDANVGTTHIITPPRTKQDRPKDRKARAAIDAFANRIFIEPNLGLGYPTEAAGLLRGIEKHLKPGDDDALKVDWDFLGVQYYQRQLVKPAPIPGLHAIPWMSKDHRRYEITAMGWEVQPDGLYEALAKVHAYDPDLRLVVTENGAAFPDRLEGGRVHDERRTAFYRAHLAEVRRAQADGIPVDGYFCWSLMDNFEWAEGYVPRFGLTHIDFATQQRTVKDSGRWFQRFLAATATATDAD